eukprot:Awhi_evm1s7938
MADMETFDFDVVVSRFQTLVSYLSSEEYWLPNDRFLSFLPVLPAWILLLYFLSLRSTANEMVSMDGLTSFYLKFHACYFFFYSLSFELFGDAMAAFVNMSPLSTPGVMYPVATAFNDLMFVTGSLYFLIGSQKEICRWVMYIPVVQTVYNLGNDYRWFYADYYGPNGKAADFFLVLLDFSTIALGFVIYSFFILTAKRVKAK